MEQLADIVARDEGRQRRSVFEIAVAADELCELRKELVERDDDGAVPCSEGAELDGLLVGSIARAAMVLQLRGRELRDRLGSDLHPSFVRRSVALRLGFSGFYVLDERVAPLRAAW